VQPEGMLNYAVTQLQKVLSRRVFLSICVILFIVRVECRLLRCLIMWIAFFQSVREMRNFGGI
jgi:abortive infection bacteriophage resistance protein